jgi:hypothetical protein
MEKKTAFVFFAFFEMFYVGVLLMYSKKNFAGLAGFVKLSWLRLSTESFVAKPAKPVAESALLHSPWEHRKLFTTRLKLRFAKSNITSWRRIEEIFRFLSFCTDHISGKQLKRTHTQAYLSTLQISGKALNNGNKPVSRKKNHR